MLRLFRHFEKTKDSHSRLRVYDKHEISCFTATNLCHKLLHSGIIICTWRWFSFPEERGHQCQHITHVCRSKDEAASHDRQRVISGRGFCVESIFHVYGCLNALSVDPEFVRWRWNIADITCFWIRGHIFVSRTDIWIMLGRTVWTQVPQCHRNIRGSKELDPGWRLKRDYLISNSTHLIRKDRHATLQELPNSMG